MTSSRPTARSGLVEHRGDAEELVAAGADAASSGRREAWLERVDRHLATTSWDRTWRGMQRLIRGVTPTKAAADDRREQRPRSAVAEGAAHV